MIVSGKRMVQHMRQELINNSKLISNCYNNKAMISSSKLKIKYTKDSVLRLCMPVMDQNSEIVERGVKKNPEHVKHYTT